MLTWARRSYTLTAGSLYSRPSFRVLAKYYSSRAEDPEHDYMAAREWYKKVNLSESLHGLGEITYSRSSGPGGQNVNKVNSKAQLRVPVDGLLKRIPTALHKGVLSSRYHAENSSSLVIQADESRKQQANKDTCYRKLNELIMDVYKHTVPGETTEDQKERVRKLQKAANEARLKGKHIHSSKKQSRSRSDGE